MSTNLQACQELLSTQEDTLQVDALLHLLIEVVKDYCDAEGASLLLHDPDTDELYFDVAIGGAAAQIKRIRMRRSTGVAGHVFETMQPVLVSEVDSDPHFSPLADRRAGFRTRSILAMPLLDSDGRRVGVVEAVNRRGRPRFSDTELSRLLLIQRSLSDAVDAAQRLRGGDLEAVAEFYARVVDIVQARARRLEEGAHELSQAQQRFESRCSHIVREARITGLCLFVAGLSHEMNNPLGFTSANLRSLAEMLQDAQDAMRRVLVLAAGNASGPALSRALSDSKICELLDDARECTGEVMQGFNRLSNVVDRLGTFANLTVQQREAVDLNDVVRVVLQRLAIKYPERQVHFEPLPLPSLPGSRVHLEQVVLDLLDNAVKNSPPEGRIDVYLAQVGSELALTVQDRGRGIAPDRLDHVFEPFFTDKRSDWRGLGLGLASVHGIVMAHGGRVEVQSTQGEGSVFVVTLPLSGPEAGPEASAPRQDPGDAGGTTS